MTNNKKFIGACCGILTGVCWGISGVFSQFLFTNTEMQSDWFVAVRMLVAGFFMMMVSVFSKKGEISQLLRNKKDILQCIVTGVLGTMLFQFACYGAVQKSNAATAIVLQYLCPVMVMIYACVKGRKLPKVYELLALFLAVAGIFLIATHGNIHELIITKEALIWGIGCAFFMSLSTIIPESLYNKYSTQTITSFALFFGGITAGIVVKPMKNPPAMDAKALAALLAAVLCGSIIAYIMYGVSIKQIGSSKASLYACSEIPAATILSLLFLKDSFAWIDILGFLLIASTIFILSKNKH